MGRLSDYTLLSPDIANRPIFGRGLNTFSPDRYVGKWIDNQYLKFGAEIGIFGVAAFAYLLWRAVSVPFRAGVKADGETGALLIALAGGAAVFAVTSATFDTIGFPQVAYLFFVLCALSAVLLGDPAGSDAAEPGGAR